MYDTIYSFRSTYGYMQIHSKKSGRLCSKLRSPCLWEESKRGGLELGCWSSNWSSVHLFFFFYLNTELVFLMKKMYYGSKTYARVQILSLLFTVLVCTWAIYSLHLCFSFIKSLWYTYLRGEAAFMGIQIL